MVFSKVDFLKPRRHEGHEEKTKVKTLCPRGVMVLNLCLLDVLNLTIEIINPYRSL